MRLSNLNFVISESPFSIEIKIKKSFVKKNIPYLMNIPTTNRFTEKKTLGSKYQIVSTPSMSKNIPTQTIFKNPESMAGLKKTTIEGGWKGLLYYAGIGFPRGLDWILYYLSRITRDMKLAV